MAKRGRAVSLDRIVSALSKLDAERKVLVAKLQKAVASVVPEGGHIPVPFQKRGPGRPAGSTGKKKRKPMSKEARAKIAAAQKKRWAVKKAGEKK